MKAIGGGVSEQVGAIYWPAAQQVKSRAADWE